MAVRLRAVPALEERGVEVIPAVARLLDDPDVGVRRDACAFLRWYGPDAAAAVPALARALEDPDASVRTMAAQALGRTGPGDASTVSRLMEALEDPEEDVRTMAAQSLSAWGRMPQGASEVLMQAAGDPARAARLAAATSPRVALPETREPARSESGRSPPPIVLVTIDALRADRLRFYGHFRDTAPALGALAASGIRFAHAYSTSSWTVPAIASILTGLYPPSHGAVHGIFQSGKIRGQEVLPDTAASLAEALRERGYRTYGIAANPHLQPMFGFARGFARFDGIGGAPAGRVNAAAFCWEQELLQPGPFFLWLHYFDPHYPYTPRRPWADEFERGLQPVDPGERDLIDRLALLPSGLEPSAALRPRLRAIAQAWYDSEIRYVDHHLGELLERLSLAERAWLIVTADHGEQFWDHGRALHGHDLFNETLRIPLLIRPPGGGPRQVVTDVASLVDIAPTAISLAGGPVPPSWQGRALLDGGGRPVPAPEATVVADLQRSGSRLAALVGERWKLILDIDSRQQWLYDLAADPGERAGVSRGERAAWMARHLLDRLDALPRPGSRRALALDPATVEQLRSLGYAQ